MDRVELIRLVTRKEADELSFILRGGGVIASVEPVQADSNGSGRYWAVLVPLADLAAAKAILREEGYPATFGLSPVVSNGPRQIPRPGLYWIVGLLVVNLLVWVATEGQGGSENREVLLRFGASYAPSLAAGQWWRTITAVFLHIGLRHLLANMITLAVLAPPVLRDWGIGRFYSSYLAAGVAGNWTSFIVSPGRSVKAGASGSILGLLGVLAGARLRSIRLPDRPSRFKSWHIIAMLIAFYGFVIGVGGTVDHPAHIGGLIAGGVMGYLTPPLGCLPRRIERILGPVLGIGSALLAAGAGLLAYLAG